MDAFDKVLSVVRSCRTTQQIESGRVYIRLAHRSGVINGDTLGELQKQLNFKQKVYSHDDNQNQAQLSRCRTIYAARFNRPQKPLG